MDTGHRWLEGCARGRQHLCHYSWRAVPAWRRLSQRPRARRRECRRTLHHGAPCRRRRSARRGLRTVAGLLCPVARCLSGEGAKRGRLYEPQPGLCRDASRRQRDRGRQAGVRGHWHTSVCLVGVQRPVRRGCADSDQLSTSRVSRDRQPVFRRSGCEEQHVLAGIAAGRGSIEHRRPGESGVRGNAAGPSGDARCARAIRRQRPGGYLWGEICHRGQRRRGSKRLYQPESRRPVQAGSRLAYRRQAHRYRKRADARRYRQRRPRRSRWRDFACAGNVAGRDRHAERNGYVYPGSVRHGGQPVRHAQGQREPRWWTIWRFAGSVGC